MDGVGRQRDKLVLGGQPGAVETASGGDHGQWLSAKSVRNFARVRKAACSRARQRGRVAPGGGRRRRGGSLEFGDAVGEVGGVMVDEAEQGRAAGVLPGQPEEV